MLLIKYIMDIIIIQLLNKKVYDIEFFDLVFYKEKYKEMFNS